MIKVLTIKPDKYDNLWLSVSKVKTFKDCAAKFRYTYIDKLPRKTWSFHITGKFAHSSLEYFHNFIKNNDTRPYNEIMTESFKLAAEDHKEATIAQKKEIWAMMNDYLAKLSKDKVNNLLPDVIGIEESFYIDIGGKVLLNGFIDRVQVDSDGMLHVTDYKTTKNKKYLKNDFLQLKTYAFVKCLQDPDLETIRTSYILLRHGFEQIVKEYTREEVMKMEQKFLDFADKITEEKLYRPTPNNLCRFCDHLERCSEGRSFISGGNTVKFGELDW